MPRRRRFRSRNRFLALAVLLAAIGLAAAWVWRERLGAAWTAWFRPAPPAASAPADPAATAHAPQAVAFDVCGLVDAAALRRALGGKTPVARHVGAAADVPAAGACTWSDGSRSLTVLVYTRASRAAAGDIADGAQYFASVLTGLEYEFKDLPRMLPGLAEAAALAGFDSDAGLPPQLVFRRGDLVVQLISRGYEASRTEAAARLYAAAL